MAYFEFVHNLGIHSWDIPALIALIAMVVMIFVHRSNQKKNLRRTWIKKSRKFERKQEQNRMRKI